MINGKYIARTGLILAAISFSCHAMSNQERNSPFWLSSTPPNMKMMKGFKRFHGGSTFVDEKGGHFKILWVKKGSNLKRSPYLSNGSGQFYLIDAQSRLHQPSPYLAGQSTSAAVKIEMADEGFYSAYYLERSVRDTVQHVSVAKDVTLKYSHGSDLDIDKMEPQVNSQIPLEILRLRPDDENNRFRRVYSGKVIKFKVLYNGKPLAGANVTIKTEEGWSRNIRSDAGGIVSFQVIQDRFKANEKKVEHKKSEGGNYRRRRRDERFLVTAQFSESATGEYNGLPYQKTVYTTTFPGQFYPPRNAYKSYAYGLILGLAGFLVLGIGTYLYRRRRIKPFKEANLDE